MDRRRVLTHRPHPTIVCRNEECPSEGEAITASTEWRCGDPCPACGEATAVPAS